MGDSIVPISTSISGPTPDRQPRRDQRQQENDEAKALTAQAEDNRAEATATVAVDLPPVVPETLFSASVLGQRMRSVAADLQTLKHKREQEWAPPESGLRLKDKSI